MTMYGTSELDGLTDGELDGFTQMNALLMGPLKWKECKKMPWTAQVVKTIKSVLMTK